MKTAVITILMLILVVAFVNAVSIKTYGVDNERVLNITSTINPKHFEGVSQLQIIYSKSKFLTADCWYYTNKKITCYIDWQSDEWLKRNILHEISHHKCFIKEGYMSIDNINHIGCFQDEYPKI